MKKTRYYGSLKEKVKYCLSLIKETIIHAKSSILSICIIFIVSIIIGILFYDYLPKEIMDYFSIIAESIRYNSYIDNSLFIAWNNIKVAFFSIILGFFFGVVPVFLAITNGFIIGSISSQVVLNKGFSYLIYIVPHGIFEIPAILLSFALGLYFGKNRNFKTLKRILLVFLFIILPLLIIAGFIESLLFYMQ